MDHSQVPCFRPVESMTNQDHVVVHIPHAALDIPPEVRPSLVLADAELERELLRMTDRFTDELFAAPGCEQVVFPVSRLVVDPESFLDDALEPMARVGMGVVYTGTTCGRPLLNGLSAETAWASLESPAQSLFTPSGCPSN